MHMSSNSTVFLACLLPAFCIGAGGCAAESSEERSVLVDDSTGEQGDAREAQLAFTASPECTDAGGGSWGAIFEMCVSVAPDGTGVFTIEKTVEPMRFKTAGTMYLQVGTHERGGAVRAAHGVNGGQIISGFTFTDHFGQWPDYPKEYYARWESDPGGDAWVGPIVIHH